MKKILIFTAGFGEGHNTAARSLCAAVQHIAPGEAEARVIDLFADCYGKLNDIARKSYLGVINRAPLVWQKIYEWLDNSTAAESNFGLLHKSRKRLAALIAEEKPDVIASTYPVYNYLLDEIYGKGGARPFSQVTIVTDSITVNSIWFRASSDYYVVPNEDTAQALRDGGVEEAKIKPLGFPITHRFSTQAVERPLPREGYRRVLFVINSGKREAPNVVRRLLELPDIQLDVTVGRDEKLRAAVEKVVAAFGKPVGIHGWTDKLPNLLMESHLLVSKAGGATVQETIAAKTPMLIMQIVPGQEEGNAKLLLGHECGALTETTPAVVKAVAAAFADDAKLWREWNANITKLSRPDAAITIAQFVLGLNK